MKFIGTRISKIEAKKLDKKAKKLKTSPYQLYRKAIKMLLKEEAANLSDEDVSIASLEQEKEKLESDLERLRTSYEKEIAKLESELVNRSRLFNIHDEKNKKILKEIFNFAKKMNVMSKHLKLSEPALKYLLDFLYPSPNAPI